MIFNKANKINVVFMGTPKIAVYALKALINRGFNVVGVITQPDRFGKKNKKLEFSPIKNFCLNWGIKIYQPNKISEIYDELVLLNPDLFVTCAYGQFIPQKILDIPKYGCINAHGSILPKYRGGAPIQWSIINGDKLTGFTLMKTVNRMDAGDMFIAYSITIEEDDNLETITSKMCKVVYLLIYRELIKILNGELQPIKQDDSKATFAYNITSNEEKLNLKDKLVNISNWIRGLYGNPTSYLIYENHTKVKVYKIEKTNNFSICSPGTIVGVSKNGIEVCTNDFNFLLKEFKIEGKNRINISEYIYGNRLFKIGGKFLS